MGNTSEPNTNGIDETVGGLVWVRRRNGSWWPGRIVGEDELSEDCLVSPKSGTPVKLLGREDAIVDWYDLQKSKRVKAFRCGEFGECIEKAKASAANSSKKAVKYARREDAIICALELESASQSGKETEIVDGELSSSFEEISSSPARELSQSRVSFEETNHVSDSREGRRRRRTPNDSEEDGMEGVKRMRGLEDLGIGVVSLKRKRSQVAHVHEFLKPKNRRRPLTKVLESTTMVSVPIICETGVSDGKVPELESNESKRSFSRILNNSESTGVSCENEISLNPSGHVNYKQKENGSSDKLFDVPFFGEEKHVAGFSPIFESRKPQVAAGPQSSKSSQVETVLLGNEEVDESGFTSSGAADIDHISWRIEKGSSKWQSKGRRNTRNRSRKRRQYSRKSLDVDDNESNVYMAGLENRGWNRHISQRSLPYRQSRFTLNPKYQTPDFLVGNYNADSSLYEVYLEVKASYRPQHVPYVSLTSKLNGQPIIGHPLTVEVLNDGFCECYLTNISCELVDNVKQKPNLVGGRIPSKSPKPRKNGLSPKKIRKLSSLTASQKRSEDEKKPMIDKAKGPTLACVPLKIVFSRINASLKGSM